MEDDDEFGDLYTDVLRPFHPPQPPPPQQPPKKPSPPTRPIDLNIHSDDDEILYGAANPKFDFTTSNQTQILGFKLEKPPPEPDGSSDSRLNLNLGGTKEEDRKVEKNKGFFAEGVSNWGSDLKEPSVSRVLASGGDVGLESKGFEDPNLMDESGIEVVVEERDGGDDLLVENDVGLMGKKESFEKFDVEEAVIPGLSIPGVSDSGNNGGGGNFATTRDEGSEGDDWDSDSEDDLQIVLNDNSHGAMAMDNRTGVVGSDDEDEDGDPLVIVADSEPGLLQPMEEQEWGDDAAQVGDGERKELGDAAKVNGGVAIVPKIGFNNHAYHPYHSQFKYVRPGAAPMPGAAPVGPAGAPGQVRPPVNMGPVIGRGRGDWRPTGIKTASPMQKSFHPGFGLPGWGNNTAGRGFGSGLEFTLPSHKTIFEVDIDSFEEKPWKLPGIDISDFFNFGLNEESWKDYCKQLEQLRLEATMQSKIRVYESGRTEQDYDPDLPPELAAAAGIHDISPENANLGKMDAGHSDVSKGSERVRPPLPTGRPIQVETGYGERLPSIDTRPPRIRDSDSIIEIVLQDSADDDSSPGNELIEKPENDPPREDFRAGQEIEGDTAEKEHFDGFSRTYNGRKREVVGRRAPFVNPIQDNLAEGAGNLPSSPEAPVQYSPDPRGQTSTYPGRGFGKPHEERQAMGRARDKSPNITRSESTQDKRYHDNQKEDSVESIGGEDRSRLSSPVTVGSAEDPDAEHVDGLHEELVLADGSSKLDREEMGLDKMSATDTRTGENPLPSLKKQKLSSQVEQSSRQEIDVGGDLKAARSSENSKARSGSSRDYQKLHDSVDEEVVQHRHSARMENLKRSHGEDEQSVRRKGRDERHEMEKHRVVEKGREDSYSRRDWDPHWAHHSHVKPETIDRRKERENSEGAWQRRDDDPHGRRARPEDARKRERVDEIGSRHRNKVRESEKMDKDEHLQLRKQLDNGYSSGHYDKDMGSRHRERDDNLKGRYENMDDLHSKRRKEEENLRRDTKMEEILHGHRENTSRRKREREDALDLHKRDDQVRARDDDHHSVRHKEETWSHRERSERQRERDEWHRLKQSQEESLLKREREEGRGGVRSGRAVEDKARVSHARMKDEYKASDRDYQFKDSVRHNEQIKKRDRIEDGSLSQHKGREDVNARGSQLNNDDRRSRQERASTRSDSVGGSDKNRTHEKKPKESMRKTRDSEGGNQNSLVPSKRNQEDKSGQMNEPVILKGTTDQGNTGREILVNRHSSKKHREDASSDDELQDSRRGRSKLERWTSHKERDFSINTKSSSSLKVKEIAKSNNGGSSSANKLPDETSNTVETIDNQHTLGDQKEASDPDIKNADAKPLEDRHLDTVAKLKKRSERFKLPMPSEKEAMVIKKMENEPLPSATGEALADSEIKSERPARKRRWISN